MLFQSTDFLIFALIVIPLYWSTRDNGTRLTILLAASLYFYAYFFWPYLILLGGVILWNFLLSPYVCSPHRALARRALLLSIVGSLLPLLFFKYIGLLLSSVAWVITVTGVPLTTPLYSPLLPLGISFFTFQAVAYQVDLYRGVVQPERTLLRFALFISFFPQLIAGPIVRATSLLPEFQSSRPLVARDVQQGLFMCCAGLALKIGVADILAQFVDQLFADPDDYGFYRAWYRMYAFSFQVLADFWGYTLLARGLGLLLGYHLPRNFSLPYFSTSFRELWRRWHMTLSTWFRDYVYIPLGGRHAGQLRSQIILLVTFAIAGLWHGAGWNYVLWGLLNGAVMVLERVVHQPLAAATAWMGRLQPAVASIVVFHVFTWLLVVFRAPSLTSAGTVMRTMVVPVFTFEGMGGVLDTWLPLFLFGHPLLHYLLEDYRFACLKLPGQIVLTVLLVLFIIVNYRAEVDFLYFQF